MKRSLTRVVVTLVLALAVVAGSQQSASADTVPHSGPNWAWAGPSTWTAAYGVYGITVLGEEGATLDLGFSSTLCASGATWEKSVKKYFKGVRRQLKNNGWSLKAGDIVHPSGFSSTYRRQVLKGTNDAQGTVKGEIVLDYDFTTSVDGVDYCYQRSLAKYANASKWKTHKKTLKQVQNSLAYSGPGAPPGQDPGDF